jgi:hypothetical protein
MKLMKRLSNWWKTRFERGYRKAVFKAIENTEKDDEVVIPIPDKWYDGSSPQQCYVTYSFSLTDHKNVEIQKIHDDVEARGYILNLDFTRILAPKMFKNDNAQAFIEWKIGLRCTPNNY